MSIKLRKPQRKTTEKNKYLTRMDYGRTHGYNVRIPVGKNNWESVFFADGKHGGKRATLKAARAYRDQLFSDRGIAVKIEKTRVEKEPHQNQSNNTSGIIGVKQYTTDRFTNGVEYLNTYTGWVADWYSDGKKQRCQYSSDKYTDCGAFQLACIVRIRNAGPLRIVDEDASFPMPIEKIKELSEKYSNG